MAQTAEGDVTQRERGKAGENNKAIQVIMLCSQKKEKGEKIGGWGVDVNSMEWYEIR